MTEFQRSFLNILISGLGEDVGQVATDIEIAKIAKCANRHQVSVLAYYGIKNLHLFGDEQMQGFKDHTYNIIYATVNQMYELERLTNTFNVEGIDYRLLKGAYIRDYYLKPEMRLMSDIDVLIRDSQYKIIKSLMKELGYIFSYESDHEITWKLPNGLIVELHKSLVPTYNKDFIRYYGDGWRVFESEEKLYEKQYIYSFVHFAKHYRDGGAGIKYVFDFYVMQKANKDLDIEYIREQLLELKLLEFYDNICKTMGVWFEGEEDTDVTNLITENLFTSGVYGSFEKHAIAKTYKKSKQTGSIKKARIQNTFSSAFSSLENNKKRHRFLNKMPFLLPVAWALNWLSALTKNHNKIGEVMKKAAVSTEENVEKFRKDLQMVGLDYYD